MNTRIYITDCDHTDVNMEKSVFDSAGEPFKWLDCKTPEEIIDQCKGAVAVINQYTKLDKQVFEAIPTLKCVVRYGVGVDNVNIDDANHYGVQVCNVPDYGMNEVADHAMALLLAIYRKVWLLGNDTKNKNWDFSIGPKIRRPEKQTIGIIGTGRIGREFAKRAHAFNFNIIAYDEYYVKHTEESERLPFIKYVETLDELLMSSDIVSLHCGLDSSNYHFMNSKSFEKMKNGAYIVNVSRGGLIDEKDLSQALDSGKIAGAGLDVFNKEPIETDNPLLSQPNCIITPHSAWYSEEASQQLKHDCAEIALAFVNGKIMEEKYAKNRVNEIN